MVTGSPSLGFNEKTGLLLFLCCFSPELFIHELAGNEEKHESSDEFESRPDLTTNGGVRCPLAFLKSL